jgi:Uncharacterized protein YfbK, C-terminal
MSRHSFTREELYELVWSEPMIKLGARFGVSGNGLKKACRRANIPVPPQGYWNKLHAGHEVTKTPLPPATAGTPAKVTIDPPVPRPAPPPPPPVPASVQEKIDAERQTGKPVAVPATLSNPHRIIDAWIQESRHEMREARNDPFYQRLYKPIDGAPLEKRRLRILSALFRAIEARGYKLIVGESYRRQVQIALGDERLEVHLDERVRQVRRQITTEDRAKGHYSVYQTWTQEKVPTGELVLKIKTERYIADKEWRESEDAPLEGMLNEVIAQAPGPKGAHGGEYGFIKIRYKLPDSDKSVLMATPVTKSDEVARFAAAPRSARFATAVAGFGELLRGGLYTGSFSYDDVIRIAQNSRGPDPYGYRAAFVQLVREAETANALPPARP